MIQINSFCITGPVPTILISSSPLTLGGLGSLIMMRGRQKRWC